MRHSETCPLLTSRLPSPGSCVSCFPAATIVICIFRHKPWHKTHIHFEGAPKREAFSKFAATIWVRVCHRICLEPEWRRLHAHSHASNMTHKCIRLAKAIKLQSQHFATPLGNGIFSTPSGFPFFFVSLRNSSIWKELASQLTENFYCKRPSWGAGRDAFLGHLCLIRLKE